VRCYHLGPLGMFAGRKETITPRPRTLKHVQNIYSVRWISVGSARFQMGETQANIGSSGSEEVASSIVNDLISSVSNEPSVVLSESAATASLTESVSSSSTVTLPLESTKAEVPLEASSLSPPETSTELILDFLPEKPTPVDPGTMLGEPSFESLGLGSWWPSGRVQLFMEWQHIDMGMEWWQSIILTTFCVRLLVFPLVIMAQKNIATMNNIMPGMAKIQEKYTAARKRGDLYEAAQLGQELQAYTKKHGTNPIKNIAPLLLQFPIFMSMFFGLRGMSNCPVESLSTGGLVWFQNLTMADPFYLLPVLTSTTLFLQLKLGADGASFDQMGPIGKTVMKVLPFCLLPVTMNFPAAVTFYWFTTNLVSVTQARIIRIPAVRKTLGVPELIKWDTKKIPGSNKPFRQSVRETIDNWKVQGEIADRRAYDEQQFRDAGSAAPKKTYKFDPTKPIDLQVSNKKRF